MQRTQPTDPMFSEDHIEDELDVRYTVREAVAVFEDEDRLESAILALQEQGIDRSRISVLGHLSRQQVTGPAQNWMRHLVDVDEAPRAAPTEQGTLAEAETAVVVLPGYGTGMLGLIAVMASGGTLGPAVATALFAGAIGSGAGYLLSRSIAKHHKDHINNQLEAGGLVLWVTLNDDDDDDVLTMLKEAGGMKAHVSQREGHWGAKDIPFSTVQPDPFL